MTGGAFAAASLMAATQGWANPVGTPKTAKVTQVRNATILVETGGVTFLIDPLFADQGSLPGFPASASSHLSNPLVTLPMPQDDLATADAVIVTHLHLDHWDDAAKAAIARDKPIFAQSEHDAGLIRADGFTDVHVLTEATEFNGVRLIKTGGQHGNDATLEAFPTMGDVCGVVFSHPEFPTLYVAGDTIWNAHVQAAIDTHKPAAIVLNAGNAVMMGFDPIIMGTEDVLAVHRAAPEAILIASHMEAINHCILSRQVLRDFSVQNGFEQKLLIPADGEAVMV
ncbi:L-ascorbate metabolism protein UlaG, beta-lactamase superfamily [Loktanella salsilacus]|uniref:L-ascorbate metabolism protein UlaG, beta-lactamase superfamily n=2 Tax=Loktanella salsilacus TaxID=195913 RepID=A0A1I4JVQ2_9RHOB|nr:L-ascorbate metabolism protein UlaG, beta-lactamase superfamily [Loktanella salsilacus]